MNKLKAYIDTIDYIVGDEKDIGEGEFDTKEDVFKWAKPLMRENFSDTLYIRNTELYEEEKNLFTEAHETYSLYNNEFVLVYRGLENYIDDEIERYKEDYIEGAGTKFKKGEKVRLNRIAFPDAPPELTVDFTSDMDMMENYPESRYEHTYWTNLYALSFIDENGEVDDLKFDVINEKFIEKIEDYNESSDKKYEILKDDYIEVYEHKLYRIRALKFLPNKVFNVYPGELGGYVESEDCLSQEGNCWVYGDSKIFNTNKVIDNAIILDSMIRSDSIIKDNALIRESIIVNCKLGGYTSVNESYISNTKLDSDEYHRRYNIDATRGYVDESNISR